MITGEGQSPDAAPQCDPVILARPRLIRRLDLLTRRRLTSVVAGPGAGKTVLLRAWATRRSTAWHTASPQDLDPTVLFGALAGALRTAGVDIPEPADTAGPAALGAALADALRAGGTAPVALVVDDAHLLGADGAAVLLEALVLGLPEKASLVVAGRAPFPSPLGPPRAAGRLADLGPAELAFTPAEARRVLRSAGVATDQPTVHGILTHCGGWPGVVTAATYLAVSPAGGRPGPQAPPGRSHGMEALDDDHRLTELVSALDDGDLAALRALTAVRQADPALRAVLEPVWDWALRRLTETRRLAGDDLGPLRATRMVLGGPVGVRDADLVLAESALRDGQHDEALRYLAAVPPETPLPAALAWQLGVLLHQRGEFAAAESLYERSAPDAGGGAAGGLSDRPDAPPASRDRARVLAGWASARWARGDQARARQLADEAVRVAEHSRDDAAIAAAYVAQALVAFSAGDRAANEHAYARALAAAERAGDIGQQLRIRSNIGSRLLEEARYREAVDELTEAIRLGTLIEQPTLLALALHNRAEAWLGLGELAEARADADRALTLWQRDGSPLAAFALLTTARVHQARGSARQATAAYREALATAEPHSNAQVLVLAWAGLARTCYADDPAEAQAYARRALALPSASGPVAAELAAGWVALCSGDAASAGRHAAEARSEAGRRRDPVGLAEAIELAVLAGYRAGPDGGTGRDAGRRVAGLVEAAAIWADAGNEVALATNALLRGRCGADPLAEDVARGRLHRLGVRDDAWHIAGPLAAIGPPPVPEVAVQTLGHFAVRLGGTPVPPASWQSRKARELIKVLAGQLGRPVGREALAALLWPDVRSEVALRRLSVLVSTVRAVLDPARRYPADHYLATDPATVRIDAEHVALDTLRFHDAARAAVAADAVAAPDGRDPTAGAEIAGRLEAVAALYTGDFCAEGEAGEWSERPRTMLAELHRDVIRRLAGRCLGLGRPEAAVGWYLRLTVEDGYDEPAHLGLISALSAAGRHGEAGRHYREYVERMREIDVEPAAFPAGGAAPSAVRPVT
ncbi:BTAD domain-containing putative transcriptional regulator [Planosporangium sp. 12N6]|uniref:BTAD domain-containing putative transcriptional regulator n=1 Tax=Planosporangium spinosum TaxID=3402278 RepID=UPI003CF101F8